MSDNNSNPSFAHAFLPGLILGLIIGAVAGAFLPDMMGGSKIKVDPNAVHSGERHERDAHGEMPIDDADEMIDEAQDTAEEVIDDATNAAEDMIDDASENLPDSP